MKRLHSLTTTALLLCAAGLSGCAAHTGEVQPDSSHPVLSIGAPAPDFSLPGVDGKTHTLSEYSGSKLLAFVFDCNHCSTSHLYESRIHKLYDDYHDKGLTLVAVSPDNPASIHYDQLAYSDANDSLLEMQDRATDRHIAFPYLYDGDAQSLTAKLGAAAAPQIFVFDQARRLRYEGRIDDNEIPDKVKSEDARNAIDALLADKPVEIATTPLAGCPTIWNGKIPPDPALAQINAETVNVNPTTPELLKKLRGNGTGKLEARPDVFAFLKKNQATSVNYLFASDDTAAVQDSFDTQMSGAVPYTLLLAPNGDVLYQEQGEISMDRLRRNILANLPDDKNHPGMQAYWASTLK